MQHNLCTNALMKTVHVLQIRSYSYWKVVLTCEERKFRFHTLQVLVSYVLAAEYLKNFYCHCVSIEIFVSTRMRKGNKMENINIKFEFAILKTIAIILQKTN